MKDLNIDFSYSVEEKPLGTYGALYNSKKYLNENYFVLFGDVITNFDLKFGFKIFETIKSDFLIVSRFSDHPDDSDLINVDVDNKITKIYRKKKSENTSPLAITGLFFGKKESLKKYTKFDQPDIFKHYLKENLNNFEIKSIISNSYIKDLGTIERYDKDSSFIEEKLKPPEKYIFLDRDETIIDNNENNKIEKIKFKEGVFKALKDWQDKKYSIFLVTNQPGVAKGFCSVKEVKDFHNKLQNLLIDNGLKPFDNIKFCPHHPESGFENEIKKYKILCDCRKPLTGMVDEILTEFNISQKSDKFIFIGDTESDYLLSKKFNADFYLIKSKFTNLSSPLLRELKVFTKIEDLVGKI